MTGGGGVVQGGGMRGGGIAVSFERLETSKKRLKIRWEHPVPVSEEVLDYQTALKEVRGNDPRPLLILRDCDACKGRDDALLSKTLDNEKTLLYTQWFHCVKLDRRVVEENHPWHALFAGDKPPHIFMTTWDGQAAVTLDGLQTQKLLWSSLAKVLRTDYQKDAQGAVRNWLRVLDRFDALDSREKELKRQVEELQAEGATKRAQRLESQLADIAKEREAAFAQEKKVIDLILKHAPEAKTAAEFDAEAAAEVEAGTGSGLLDRIRKDKAPTEGDKKSDG